MHDCNVSSCVEQPKPHPPVHRRIVSSASADLRSVATVCQCPSARAVCVVSSHNAVCSQPSATHQPQVTSQTSGRVLLASTTPAMVYSTSLFVLVLVACMFYLCVHLPSSVPMAAAFELEHLKSSSPSTVSTASSATASTSPSSDQQQHRARHLLDNDIAINSSGLFRLLSREPREPSAALPSYLPPLEQAQIRFPTFTILAILPEENAPLITRALRDAQAKWEVSGHTSAFAIDRGTSGPKSRNGKNNNNNNKQQPLIRASDIPLVVYSEPANNDTERILSSVCEWIAVHNPAMVLSLLDKDRNFYASLVAESAGIPFVSLTQTYRNEINTISDDHQLEIDFKQATESLFDRFPTPPPPSSPEEPNIFGFLGPNHSPLKLSLDPPIQSLADATFELLRAQYWFDAILIVDDSVVSDLFARRLNALCRNGNGNGNGHGGQGYGGGGGKRRQTHNDAAAVSRRLQNSLYGDEFGWSNFKKSSLRKSQFRIDVLNSDDEDVSSDESTFSADDPRRSVHNNEDVYEVRRSKEASLLDVWKNLIVIRLSRSLAQTEFYLQMARIQTTHRRVVLMHTDWSTTQRVIETARELDLFKGDKIWMLLDGLLGDKRGLFETNPDEFLFEDQHVDLPNGMLALRNRRRLIYEPSLLDSIVELAGKAALNSYRNELYWGRSVAPNPAATIPLSSSRSPFQLSPSASSSLSSSSSSPNTPSSSSSSFSSANSDSLHSGCSVANYTEAEKEHRLNILSELRNLVEPILSRYRWNRRKPCSSLRSSARKASKRFQNGRRSSNSRSNSANDINHYRMDEPGDEDGSRIQDSDEANTDAEELDARISASDLYRWIVPEFEILNLVPRKNDLRKSEWRTVGNVTVEEATVNTILYIGADQVPDYIMYDGRDGPYTRTDTGVNSDARPLMYMTNSGKHRFRVATNIAPPFVIESTKLDNNTCLTGDFCLKIDTNVRDDLIAIFTDFRSNRRLYEGKKYQVKCCAGIAIDLLNAVARDLHFDYDLYLVADGLFGVHKDGKWDGVTADLVNDLAHLSFTAFSTTSSRVQAIDYSVPFFYSGVSCLSVSSNETDVPLLAFLIPFSYELWGAIFAGLFATAVAAAIYEWFSPFGLNPWGRQRTKNFSLASALWVMCSLLFSHLVAFKAPKSWPNKVLINVWGAFSVIFLATYTANIAAHFAGLFLVPEVNDFHDTSLMKQRTGTARSSASEGYLMEKYTDLWNYIQRYKVDSFDEGLEHLRAGKLDVLIGDTAILDYFRATDPGCSLRLLGDSIFDDAYAVGMQKGFPFRESISNLILKYNEYGFLDQLHRKWYGRVHCLESSSLTKPKPLTVRAEAGVFLMLGFGIIVGIVILLAEHFVFKYMLPGLRKKSKDCFWKSPNLMFFSQKLYRFINTVELVSPHHSAKEIITNLREGQIASLFQKSVKRKAKEEARRRKSKSQFFEMIQEVRKVVQRQQHERSLQEDDDEEEEDDIEDLDIDEEAAFNTDTNIRVTRPSFSLSKENSLLDSDRMANRTSAIRFKEPEIYDESNRKFRGANCSNKSASASHRLISNLKNPVEPKQKTAKLGDLSSSFSNETDDSGRAEQYRSDIEQTKHRREALRKSHLSSTSFSLENIFFEGLLSEGISDPRKETTKRRRILSFEDLPAIKKELSESSNDGTGPYDGPSGSSGYFGYEESARITPPKMYATDTTTSTTTSYPSSKMTNGHKCRIPKSTTTPSNLTSAAEPTTPRPSSSINLINRISNRHIGSLSSGDILSLWRTSERELMTRLQDSIEQKRALEEKVALLQRMLRKPP